MADKGEVKTGADHLAALRDGREVYIDGERVADVTTHPAFRNAVHAAAGGALRLSGASGERSSA